VWLVRRDTALHEHACRTERTGKVVHRFENVHSRVAHTVALPTASSFAALRQDAFNVFLTSSTDGSISVRRIWWCRRTVCARVCSRLTALCTPLHDRPTSCVLTDRCGTCVNAVPFDALRATPVAKRSRVLGLARACTT